MSQIWVTAYTADNKKIRSLNKERKEALKEFYRSSKQTSPSNTSSEVLGVYEANIPIEALPETSCNIRGVIFGIHDGNEEPVSETWVAALTSRSTIPTEFNELIFRAKNEIMLGEYDDRTVI